MIVISVIFSQQLTTSLIAHVNLRAFQKKIAGLDLIVYTLALLKGLDQNVRPKNEQVAVSICGVDGVKRIFLSIEGAAELAKRCQGLRMIWMRSTSIAQVCYDALTIEKPELLGLQLKSWHSKIDDLTNDTISL